MTDTDRILCRKMQSMGYTVALKSTESKWTFIDPTAEISEERSEKLRAAGVCEVDITDGRIYYFLKDWHLRNFSFYPRRMIAISVPVVASYNLGRPFIWYKCIKTAEIDLTDFYGVTDAIFLYAEKLIIGNGMCLMSNSVKPVIKQSPYMETLLGCRDLMGLRANARNVTIVGDEPVTSLCRALMSSYVETLDMSDVNLSECQSFAGLCNDVFMLRTVDLGKNSSRVSDIVAFNATVASCLQYQ